METEGGDHSVVFNVWPNTGDTTLKSDLAIGLIQGKLLLSREEFRVVLRDYESAAKFIRPLVLDGIWSLDEEKISNTNPIRLYILTTTQIRGDDRGRASSWWGSRRSCRYIRLKRKMVINKVTLTRLIIVIAFECQVFGHNDCCYPTSTIF